MNCNVIATGSTGNAVLVGGILFDCGVPYKLLAPYLQSIRLVLLTHEHGDHLRPATVRRIHKERPTLRFGCGPWLAAHLLAAGVDARNIDILTPGQTYDYGGRFQVQSFELRHDVPNCGWRLWIGGETALYATDTGSMDGISAPGLDLYMIEANYTEDDLAERVQRKLEAGEYIYETRAATIHLSREAADLWLAENAGPNSRVVYLHQHVERS